jgi:hypothetical protein
MALRKFLLDGRLQTRQSARGRDPFQRIPIFSDSRCSAAPGLTLFDRGLLAGNYYISDSALLERTVLARL